MASHTSSSSHVAASDWLSNYEVLPCWTPAVGGGPCMLLAAGSWLPDDSYPTDFSLWICKALCPDSAGFPPRCSRSAILDLNAFVTYPLLPPNLPYTLSYLISGYPILTCYSCPLNLSYPISVYIPFLHLRIPLQPSNIMVIKISYN